MRFKRLVAGIITGGMLGLAPMAVTPAQADESAPARDSAAPAATQVATSSVIKLRNSPRTVTWGNIISFDGRVTAADGGPVSVGTQRLERKIGKGPWRVVSTADGPSDAYYGNLRVTRRNTYFRVTFSGAIDELRDRHLTWSASRSIRMNVRRKVAIKLPSSGTKITVRVAPSYKRGKVVLYKKVGKRWKKFRTLRTNKRSRLQHKVPAYRKRTTWKFVAPGNRRILAGHSQTFDTYRSYWRANGAAQVSMN